jgi:deoxyuridine 5'-triphosphate nucleotidohydrolase
MASQLRVQLLSPFGKAPVRASASAAGYDLCAAYDGSVPKRGKALLKTDIAIAVPHGTYGRVAPRSGLTLKNGIDVGAGVIDEDYRGNVGVILFNHSDEDFSVKAGDRIAQLILEKIEVAEVNVCETLEDTARGAGGFGSTGVSSSTSSEVDPKKARIE